MGRQYLPHFLAALIKRANQNHHTSTTITNLEVLHFYELWPGPKSSPVQGEGGNASLSLSMISRSEKKESIEKGQSTYHT